MDHAAYLAWLFIYVTVDTLFRTRRHWHWLHHSFGFYWRLRPSRRQNKSRVTQRLISADIHKICREHASVCCHIVAMVHRIWRHYIVSMTLPRQLGWLGETSQAFSPPFFLNFQLLFFSSGHPFLLHSSPHRLLSGLSSVFPACLLFKWEVFSLFQSIRSSKSTRSSPPPSEN